MSRRVLAIRPRLLAGRQTNTHATLLLPRRIIETGVVGPDLIGSGGMIRNSRNLNFHEIFFDHEPITKYSGP